MFYDASVDWDQMGLHHLLLLRAAAPPNVFTQTGKVGFLNAIGLNNDFREMSKILFESDAEFLRNLPDELLPARYMLQTIMEWAADIRRG